MLTPFVLLFGLTVATAVIAYWSDNLGKKLGKKRVSLFGLRPRTTATLLTVASSWGIMLFTLGVLLGLWSPLRHALLRYDWLRDRTYKLEKDVREQEEKTAVSAQLLSATQGRLSAARTDLNSTRAELDTTQTSLDRARQGQRMASRQAQTARRQASAARREVAEAHNQLGATRAALNTTRESLFSAQDDLRTVQQKYRQANEQLRLGRVRLAAVNTQLADAKVALKRAEADRAAAQRSKERAANDALKSGRELIKADKELARARSEVAQAQSELARAQSDVEASQNKVAELQAEADRLSQQNEEIKDAALNLLAFGEIRFAAGRTVAEFLLPANQNQAAVRQGLDELWVTANQNFETWKDPNDPRDRDMRLTLLALPIQEGNTQRTLNADEIFEEVAKFVANRPSPISVRLAVAANFLRGQQNPNVTTRFVVVPSTPEFNAGAEIVHTTIDGRLGDAKIFKALLDLVESGRDVAEAKGIRPPQSPQLPDFYATGTNEQLFEALRRISAAKRPVPVSIVASEALNTAQPLRVRFEVGSS